MNNVASVNTSSEYSIANDARVGMRRTLLLTTLTIILIASAFWIHGRQRIGTAELHTIMEVLATVIGGFAAVLAFLRYYARRNSSFMFLCLATGLFATSLLDAYHVVVTSTLITQYPVAPSSAHWSWNASRFLFSVVMLLCWAASRADLKRKRPPVSEWVIYGGVAAFTIITAIFFTVIDLPTARFPERVISRPVELVSGIIFLITLVGFLQLRTWRTESFHFWLVCALIIASVCQLLVMPRSSSLFDPAFEWAHVLKILSYQAILVGLMIDIYQLHRTIDHVAESLDQANHRLRVSEERFALASEGSDNGLWDWDVQTDRVWYAPRFWELLGYGDLPHPPAVVESFNRHLHPDDYDATWEAVDRHLNQGAEFDVLYRLRHLTNGYRWFRARAVAKHNVDGTPVRMSGSIQDITEAILAERQLKESSLQLQRSNEELQQFAYVASHDLQEPLRAIAGYCSLLQQFHKDGLDEEGQQFVTYAVDGAKRMQALINSLLDFSRVRTHGKPFEPTDINDIVRTATENLAAQIRESGAEIHVTDLPKLNGDSSQLTQLFQNLMSNAIKFQQDGIQPKIVIHAELQSDEWVFSLNDNGIGIESRFFERIFTVFQRLHTREEYTGTGIGLAICKKVVERHHGRIWLESENGTGSTFFFTIPQELNEDNNGSNREQPNSSGRDPVS